MTKITLEEEKKELSKEEKREIYKEITRYVASAEFQKIVTAGKEYSEELKEDIYIELAERVKAEAFYSEVDKYVMLTSFYTELIKDIGTNKKALYVVDGLKHYQEKCTDQVEKKVQVGFDIAMYSKMDMLKLERAEYECIEDTINSIKDTFNVKEDEEVPTVPEHSSEIEE